MEIKDQRAKEMQSNSVETNSDINKNHKKPPTAAEIKEWLVSYIAELLEIDNDKVDIKAPFDRYGLDSSAVVGMTCDLEKWLGLEVDPTLPYDYTTIETLAQHLAEEIQW